MDVKEKLIYLLTGYSIDTQPDVEYLADSLINNGVTVQDYGHWVSYQSDEPYGSMDDKEWYRCSKCGKDAYGRYCI